MSARRIALVGCGSWGRNILRDLRSLGCEVPVVARSDASITRAHDGGAETVVPDLSALGDLDGVVIASPELAHAACIEAALNLDVPVYCEKPLTVDPTSAARLAGAGRERLFVMDKWRYHPGIEALRDLVASGELGPVAGLRSLRLGWGTAHPTSDSSWHLATHDLSIALEILGSLPRPRAAVAEVSGGWVHGLDATLGDSPWVKIEVSSARAERRREVQVVCERGVAWLPDSGAEAIGVGVPGDEISWRRIGQEMPLLSELRAFTEHLGGGPPPRSSAAEGAAMVAVLGDLRELAGLERASPESGDWPV